MQIQTRNISGIHCKVSCNDQFRRFVFNGTNFSSLVKQIQQILVLEKEFVLKYKDNEGDQITISSDEELSCALSFSSGNVFRLIVVPRGTSQMSPAPMQTAPTTPPIQTTPTIPPMQTAPTTPPMQTTPTIPPMQTAPTTSPDERQCGGRRGGRGRGGYEEGGRGGRRGRGGYEEGGRGRTGGMCRKNFENRCDEGKCDKRAKKLEKKNEKMMRKNEKKNRRAEHLSEEDQTQIALIKSQIDALKPGLKEIKNLIREKKEALKDDQKQAIHAKLKVEIQDLKAAKETKRNEVVSLKQKIRDLKYQN